MSTRSDQSLSQGQASDLGSDAALQQVITERNSLRSQNDQLWKIIEKQRIIIQNLQKDVAKVVAERDLLRRYAAENENFRNNGVQVNGNHHHSKRSMERKAQDNDSSATQPEQSSPTAAGEKEKEKDVKLASMSSSSSSLSDSRQQQDLSDSDIRVDAQTPKSVHQPEPVPLTPSSTCDGDSTNDEGKDNEEHGRPSTSQEDETVSQESYDPEIQVATTGNRIQQTPSSSSPVIAHDRDARMLPMRSDSTQSLSGQNQSPVVGSPTNLRNISASIALGAIGANLPHPPPRSPRRERREVGDSTSSPATSDNEDDSYPGSQNSKRKGVNAGKYSVDQPSPLSQQALQSELQDQDAHVMSASKVYVGQSEFDPVQPGIATRKTISGQIPTIPANIIVPQGHAVPELSILTPPATSLNSASTPASPIAAIIDQDAEKFRVYMSKLSNPRRNVSAPIQVGRSDSPEYAAALGQAVAMENIQNQIDIQTQLLGQLQNHSGRVALNPVNGASRGNVSSDVNGLTSADGEFGRQSGEGNEQEPSSDFSEKSGGQLELPENRLRKRDSNLQLFDDYPKITARTTSHQRDEDDSASGHGISFPPKRYDSHHQSDPSQTGIARVASPTPSGNSSVTALTPSSSSRSAPTFHQQAFSMFADNLEFVSILVVGSNISTNDKGREQLTFLISIGQEVQGENEDMLSHKEEDELWRVEKQYIDFVNLDSKLRITQSRNIVNSLPKLPDKSLFTTHAPSKVDARKVALEQYLQSVTSLRIKDTRDLCEFLSTNVVEREKRKDGNGQGWKEGYLTKRGKNFGGWKTRYFMLRGPVLEYFDSKDGHHLGSIALTNAQIGRQQTPDKPQESASDPSANDPNSYRHAFLILEPKKGQTVVDAKKNPNGVIRHVLCAETDQERDEWVNALMLYVGKDPSEIPESSEKPARKLPEIQKLSATPIKDLQSVKGNEKLLLNQEAYERQQRSLPASQSTPQLHSQGRNGSIPQSPTMPNINVEEGGSGERPSAEGSYPNSRGNNSQQPQLPKSQSSQSLPQEEASKLSPEGQSASHQPANDTVEKKQKSRMTFWPKKVTKEEPIAQMPATSQQGAQQQPGANPPAQGSWGLSGFLGSKSTSAPTSSNGNTSNPNLPVQPQVASSQPPAPARQVFGVSLEQAIEQAQVQPGYELPAVVYRCIEYLNAHKAKLEEGIYRLNGSAAVIKGLKERFNNEGDVPLLQEEEYYDIHAIAGLLKLFLRELPSSVLTREAHKDFLQVIELPNRSDRVDELTRLVAALPEANYTILRALTAHLIEIVDNADVNKMTARNVGIVFSPTLGIPAGVFALLMSDFDQIFHTNDGRIMPLENSDMLHTPIDDNVAADTGMDAGPMST
ncbi:hypothetical protein BGX20_009312 [Mortierella sp. AD010]|nr:hypothetical protein BGX20_009312 [Mortierella sp. AD010]